MHHAPPKASTSLEECQQRAIHKIFAQVEYKRREVEERTRKQQQREQQQEEEEKEKEVSIRKFDQHWRQEGRVDKRVGNWRDFHNQPRSKKQRDKSL
mmetsp:Transcript_25408/g.39037  ORF Transcript_25408/g.39037 Transcript_25408/m.39037 type:complete len:97 (-) Transcript_25408:95-385(-)